MASPLRTFIVLVPGGQANLGFPAIVAAARVYGAARRLRADRIRVEHAGGVRIADFALDTVAAYIQRHRLSVTPDRVARPDRDYELRRPTWSGLTLSKE